uniref:Uncharacterized protein n=1 Tax=Ditylenchus dipsaci TaxID=166011 RepID=A0A915DGS7_9BILA
MSDKLVKSIQISLSKKLVLSCAYDLPLLKSHCIKGIQSMTQDERSLRQFDDLILCPTSLRLKRLGILYLLVFTRCKKEWKNCRLQRRFVTSQPKK